MVTKFKAWNTGENKSYVCQGCITHTDLLGVSWEYLRLELGDELCARRLHGFGGGGVGALDLRRGLVSGTLRRRNRKHVEEGREEVEGWNGRGSTMRWGDVKKLGMRGTRSVDNAMRIRRRLSRHSQTSELLF